MKKIRGQRIKPLELTQFWHRRICEATMFVSGIIIALYFWVFLNGDESMATSFFVTNVAVILSAVTFLLSSIAYLWAPKKFVLPVALLVYALLAATTATLAA
ncbi:MAG: hypothetical protein ABJA64_02020, partial [Candidatus Saccharibacteria bacterium]